MSFHSLALKSHFLISQILSPEELDRISEAGWREEPLFFGLNLYYQSGLEVAAAISEEREVYLVGTAFDSSHPEAGQEAIAATLLESASSSFALEKRLDLLAGRWVVLCRRGNAAHLYHDAAGLRTVYKFRDKKKDRQIIVSQPSVLREFLNIDDDREVVR
jgi:hypothetical protein